MIGPVGETCKGRYAARRNGRHAMYGRICRECGWKSPEAPSDAQAAADLEREAAWMNAVRCSDLLNTALSDPEEGVRRRALANWRSAWQKFREIEPVSWEKARDPQFQKS